MRDDRYSSALHRAVLIAALSALAACGRTPHVATSSGPGARRAPVASTTSTTHGQESDDESDHAEHTGALTPTRSAELGLHGPDPATSLTNELWSNPQAVATRFVLADTTYSASEDAGAVNARRAAYATPRLAADLAASSSGGARLEELRRRHASFVGQVEALSTSEDTGTVAVVQLTVGVTLTTNDAPPDRRVRFYQLTLGRDAATGHWLVARAEQS
jgi:hypothetical protein